MATEARDIARSGMAQRVARDACLVIGGVGLVLLAFEVWVGVSQKNWLSLGFGGDYDYCMALARGWMHDGSYFHADQLAGSRDWKQGDVVYPPVALWLFVPFTFLPEWLWYGIPFGVVAAAFWRLRPSLWACALIPILLVSPEAVTEVTAGNPLIWVVAGVFAAVAWGTPASLILFKPSLLPFAFFGVHRRRWWLGLGLLGLLSLPFAGLTVTWIQVILNTHGRVGPFYNAEEFPYVAIPLVAWLGSSRFTMSEGRARVRRTAKSLLGRLGPKPVDDPEGSAVPEQSER